MISLLLVLAVCGVILALVPMQESIRNLLVAVVIVYGLIRLVQFIT